MRANDFLVEYVEDIYNLISRHAIIIKNKVTMGKLENTRGAIHDAIIQLVGKIDDRAIDIDKSIIVDEIENMLFYMDVKK